MPTPPGPVSWVAAFANELGVQTLDTTLLSSSAKVLDTRARIGYPFSQLLEFSFCTSGGPSAQALRYVIDVTSLGDDDARAIAGTGIGLLEDSMDPVQHSSSLRRLDTLFDGDTNGALFAVGAEHVADGSLCTLKTYWRLASPVDELGSLLPKAEERRLSELIVRVQSFWPRWERARLIGIDDAASGDNALKVYLPQKDLVEPLSLVTLCTFLLSLGWQVDVEAFPKLSYFILGRRVEVEPTAYSLGLAMAARPSVKLEIAAQAYFSDSQETLQSACCLAESLGLDSSFPRAGVEALEQFAPLSRPPVTEVICLAFYPDGNKRITLYCRP